MRTFEETLKIVAEALEKGKTAPKIVGRDFFQDAIGSYEVRVFDTGMIEIENMNLFPIRKLEPAEKVITENLIKEFKKLALQCPVSISQKKTNIL